MITFYNKGLFCGFFVHDNYMFTSEAKAATIGIPGARKMKRVDEWVSIFPRQNIHGT